MGAVASFVSDVVEGAVDIVGDVVEGAVDLAGDAIEAVGDAAESVVEGALKDPIGTVAKVAAVATGNAWALPMISAGTVVANGGDLGDALKAGAITYAAQGIGGWAADEVGAAANYGTDLGSQQTAMLAAQDAGMGMSNALGGAAGAATGAATGALLSGGDVGQAIMGGLAGYGARLGMNLTTNGVGQIINEAGNVVADSYNELASMMGDEIGDQAGDYPTTTEDLLAENDMLGQTADQPGDFPTTTEELAAADTELGGLPSINEGDQPGDFPTTQEDLATEDMMMGDTADQPGDYPTTPEELATEDAALGQDIGDQPGDYPLTPEELAATDNTLDQTADQPGDYDTTPQEMAESEAILAEMPDALPSDQTDLNLGAVGDYFKNQFSNSFLKSLIGGSMGSGYVARSGNAGNVGTNASPFTIDDSATGGDGSYSAPTSSNQDISLYGAGQDNVVAPQSVLKNLGWSGSFINPNAQTYYQTPTDAENAKNQNRQYLGWQGAGEDMFGQSTQNDPYNMYSEESPTGYAAGGLTALGEEEHIPSFYSEGGMENSYVRGEGDGTSDSVKAMLARGEFVIPADVVANLGNGDNEAGAEVLDEFMRTIREHKRSTDPNELPPDSKGPLDYLKVAYKKAGR